MNSTLLKKRIIYLLTLCFMIPAGVFLIFNALFPCSIPLIWNYIRTRGSLFIESAFRMIAAFNEFGMFY